MIFYDWLIALYRNVDFQTIAIVALGILLPSIYFQEKRKMEEGTSNTTKK